MPHKKKWRVGFPLASVLCFSLVACTGDGTPPNRQPPPSAQIDALFSTFTAGDSPGVAAMVIRDGEVIHEVGYGMADIEKRIPINSRSAFRLASVSKQFTAMAIMILAERGGLDYDDRIVTYLPELERFGDQITIRHLLTHTGGLPDYYDALSEVSGDSMPTTEQAMDFLAGWGEALFPAGERYEYSNPGYEMLALVVERASGQTFGDFLQANVFEPLGMKGSVAFENAEVVVHNRAFGYSREDQSFVLNDDDPLNLIIGSGGIYSTVEDLYLWDQALYTEDLVSRATLEEAWSPARLNNGNEHSYGFGWSLGSYGTLGRRMDHGGSWVGFRTFILRYPEQRFSVILLSNLEDFEGEVFAHRIADTYYPSTLIENATVVDGTGKPRFQADLRIEGERIAAIGALDARPGEMAYEGDGLVLAPGFIDSHSHADSAILEHPEALAVVSQGITTVVGGQDGGSELPLSEFIARLEWEHTAVNVASYAGHGTLRAKVMGEDFKRPATEAEIEQMRELLALEMEAGALGLSTGLEYDPGIYSTTAEVVELARIAAARGGRYISHIRSEDRRFWEAVHEILTIGREAQIPVQISHIKLALRSLHGETERLLGLLDAARAEGIEVTADIYPYTYWQSTLTVMFPDRNYEDPEAAAYAVEQIAAPEDMLIPVFEPDPSLAGKTLAEIAALRGTDAATTLIDLIRESEAMREARGPDSQGDVESVIAKSMTESDIERLMTWSFINICTDGELDGSHPRGYGSFPRVLGHYVRERQVLSLEQAVRRMTWQAASNLGLHGRGRIEEGSFADLVLFDPEMVRDRATPESPQALSGGIEMVWVNGRLVYEDEHVTGRRPGSMLRRNN